VGILWVLRVVPGHAGGQTGGIPPGEKPMPINIHHRVLALVLTLVLLLPGAAAHAASRPASGQFTVTFTAPPQFEQVGGTCVVHASATFVFTSNPTTGGLDGAIPFEFTIVQSEPCPLTLADKAFRATGIYAGAVSDGSGTLAGTFDAAFQGHIDADGNARGTLVVLAGAGGLSGLHGALTLTGIEGCCGSYAGTLVS
jgi:hypothetical protein